MRVLYKPFSLPSKENNAKQQVTDLIISLFVVLAQCLLLNTLKQYYLPELLKCSKTDAQTEELPFSFPMMSQSYKTSAMKD